MERTLIQQSEMRQILIIYQLIQKLFLFQINDPFVSGKHGVVSRGTSAW